MNKDFHSHTIIPANVSTNINTNRQKTNKKFKVYSYMMLRTLNY